MLRSRLASLTAAALVWSLGGSTLALAQEAPIAEQLFREGKRLLADGQVAQACKAFEGSYRKEAALTTLLNLADCRERNGQYATAWGYFLEVERLARGKADASNYRATAAERATKLESRLSFLTINVPAASNVDGLQIRRNGIVVDSAEWNTPIPADGGTYSIVGEADGFERWSSEVTLAPEADKKSVSVPSLRRKTTTEPAMIEPARQADGSEANERGTVAPAILATGGVLVVAGLTSGYLARSKWNDAEAICGADHVCDTTGERMRADELVDSARLRASIATVATGAGVVAAGVGTYLLFRHGRRRMAGAPVSFDVRHGRDVVFGFGVRGAF